MSFRTIRTVPLPHLRGSAVQIVHEASGANILHLHNDDPENLFSVTFPTPPPDDTGVPHILEHSVLAGSRRFRVKDPFFEMIKGSMATFINAMTGSDYTVYPVASNVRKDFGNLAEVYWDAVFHPLLTEQTFQREGHHLEVTESGELIIKGIVYNEMKGARSSPESKVNELIERHLWPDTPYGRDSGGDPEHIPELTWQGLRKFHQTYYHPSNAFIFLYGDIPTSEHLDFLGPRLAEFAGNDFHVRLPSQPRWKEPRSVCGVYPVGETDALNEKTFLVLNWLVGSSTNVADVFAPARSSESSSANQAAPLRKTLIDSKLGEDLSHSGLWFNGVDASFHIGLKGSEASRLDDLAKLVEKTLASVADEGVSRERFDSALQQLAYRHLEITASYPLHVMNAVMEMWMHEADPLELLYAEKHLDQLKLDYAANPGLFSTLIRERLLNNPHRLTIVVEPDRKIQAKEDAELAKKMQAMKASLTAGQLNEIIRNQKELQAELDAPNSPEALASLPQLRVRDLPAKPRHIPTKIESLSDGLTLLDNDALANGVNYLQISFDLTGLPQGLFAYLPLYGDCVHKMGAAGKDYAAIAQRVAAFTGGVGFGAAVASRVDDPAGLLRQGTFTTKFLDANAEDALAILHDLIFSIDPTDKSRLADVLRQSRAHHRTRPAHDGMGIALRHAARGINAEGFLQETLSGLPQINLFERIAAENPDPVIDAIGNIRNFLLKSARVTASFTGTNRIGNIVRKRLTEWTQSMNRKSASEIPAGFKPFATPPREALAAPMNTGYCTMAMSAPHSSHKDAPILSVAARLLSLTYVLEEVRFKGTAYGGGCGFDGNGRLFSFHSYRDPWIHRTLDVFAGALDHVKSAPWTQDDVDRAIIGTAKEGERPIRPGPATGTALWRHLAGDSRERRESRHAAILATQLPDVRRVLTEQFTTYTPTAAVCVVSSREKLTEANRQRPSDALDVSDIFPTNSGVGSGAKLDSNRHG